MVEEKTKQKDLAHKALDAYMAERGGETKEMCCLCFLDGFERGSESLKDTLDELSSFDKIDWLMTMTWMTYARQRRLEAFETAKRLGRYEQMEEFSKDLVNLDSEHSRLTTMFKEYALLRQKEPVIESESQNYENQNIEP